MAQRPGSRTTRGALFWVELFFKMFYGVGLVGASQWSDESTDMVGEHGRCSGTQRDASAQPKHSATTIFRPELASFMIADADHSGTEEQDGAHR